MQTSKFEGLCTESLGCRLARAASVVVPHLQVGDLPRGDEKQGLKHGTMSGGRVSVWMCGGESWGGSGSLALILDSHLALTGRAVIVMVLDRVTPSASSHTYLVREKHWGSGSPCGRRCVRDVGLKQGQGQAFAQSVAQVSTKARSSSIRTPSSSSLKPRNPSTTKRLPPSSPRPDSLPLLKQHLQTPLLKQTFPQTTCFPCPCAP